MRKKSMFGAFLIILSLYLIGEMMGLFVNMPGLFQIALTILLVSISFSNLWKLDFFGIIMPITLIAMMYKRELGIAGNKWMILLAGLLLSTGLKIVFKGNRKKYSYPNNYRDGNAKGFEFRFGDDDHEPDFDYEEGSYTDSQADRDDERMKHNQFRDESDHQKQEKTYSKRSRSDERLSVSATFSGRTRYVRSENFTYANLECSFGSLDVYFDEATFNPNGSEINIDCNFGAVKLYLPKNITVDNRVDVTFGSGAEDSSQFFDGGPVVRITGDVNMGAIEIYYN